MAVEIEMPAPLWPFIALDYQGEVESGRNGVGVSNMFFQINEWVRVLIRVVVSGAPRHADLVVVG